MTINDEILEKSKDIDFGTDLTDDQWDRLGVILEINKNIQCPEIPEEAYDIANKYGIAEQDKDGNWVKAKQSAEDLGIKYIHVDGACCVETLNCICDTIEELDKEFPIDEMKRIIKEKKIMNEEITED